MGNIHKNGFASTSAKNKYLGKNITALPLGNLGTKKIYKCAASSMESHGRAIAYGLSSHQGSVRPYNEDRVVAFQTQIGQDPVVNMSFFAVYDGHGGQTCAKFLSDQLHKSLVEDKDLLKNPSVVMRKHILEADARYLKMFTDNPTNTEFQRAGSCLNVVIILDDI